MWKTKLVEKSSYKRRVRQTKTSHYRQMRRRRGAFLCFDIDCNAGLEFYCEVVGEDGDLLYELSDKAFVKFGDAGLLLSDEFLKLGDCGGFFGSKVWNSTNKYRKVIWRCNNRYRKNGKKDCATHHVVESEVQYRFITAYNKLMTDKTDIIDDCETALAVLSVTAEIDAEIKALEGNLR